MCLPSGPTKHQVLSWLSTGLSNGPCTSSSRTLRPLHVHQAIKSAPKPRFTFNDILGSDEAWLGRNTYKTPVKANKGVLSTFCQRQQRKVRLCLQHCGAWMASCCCSLPPAASCFLLLPASAFIKPLAASTTGQDLGKDCMQ